MEPIKFPEVNITFGENQKGVMPVPAYAEQDPRLNPHGEVISAWQLSDEEKAIIAETGIVYLAQWTGFNPPMPLMPSVNKSDFIHEPTEEELGDLKMIEIWQEGYSYKGKIEPSKKLARIAALDFDDAIKIFKERNPNTTVDNYDGPNAERSKYGIFGCRLFDNEQSANEI